MFTWLSCYFFFILRALYCCDDEQMCGKKRIIKKNIIMTHITNRIPYLKVLCEICFIRSARVIIQKSCLDDDHSIIIPDDELLILDHNAWWEVAISAIIGSSAACMNIRIVQEYGAARARFLTIYRATEKKILRALERYTMLQYTR